MTSKLTLEDLSPYMALQLEETRKRSTPQVFAQAKRRVEAKALAKAAKKRGVRLDVLEALFYSDGNEE